MHACPLASHRALPDDVVGVFAAVVGEHAHALLVDLSRCRWRKEALIISWQMKASSWQSRS